MSVQTLALQTVKYQQRNGVSHRDVLRLCHPKATSDEMQQLFRYIVGKSNDCKIPIIVGFEAAKKATSDTEICKLIREYDLPRECIPTNFLNSVKVWEALLEKMPLTALVRNLGKMSSVGLIKPLSQASVDVCARLRDQEALKKARVHPMQLLIAQRIYQQGRGDKGSLTWTTDQQVLQALDDGFYLAFDAVVPANKRFLLALDVSGSMAGGNVAGSPLTPRDASAAMALVTARTEPYTHIIGFTGRGFSVTGGRGSYYGDGVEPLSITPKMDLQTAIRNINGLPMGCTDCALPMLYALEKGLDVDAFVVLTDSETWYGDIHPFQALKKYRDKTGIPAKLIVVGMVANKFTIADPADFGSLDIVGFDTATPALISDFVRE